MQILIGPTSSDQKLALNRTLEKFFTKSHGFLSTRFRALHGKIGIEHYIIMTREP